MTRGTASFIGEVNELREIKRRLKRVRAEYEEALGYPLEVSVGQVHDELTYILNGEPRAFDPINAGLPKVED